MESSLDGGITWARDYAPSKRYRETVVDDLGEKCDKLAVFDATDLAVVDTPDGPVVSVALRDAGMAVRSTSGSWTRVPVSYGYQVPAPSPAPLVPLDPVPRRPPEPTGGRPTRPTPTCEPQCRQGKRNEGPRPA